MCSRMLAARQIQPLVQVHGCLCVSDCKGLCAMLMAAASGISLNTKGYTYKIAIACDIAK